jgi:hypothetical protein
MAADYKQPDYVEKRVRYFDGQFLKDQDFVDEQKYHIDRQRRSLRHLHVSGVVEGLTVKPGNQQSSDVADLATVLPGTAINSLGQQIVLGSLREIPLKDFRNQTVEIFIFYQEVPSDLAQEGGESNRRWFENPEIVIVKTTERPPENAIRLAKLNINGDGNVTHDPDLMVRQYAGVKLPSADGTSPTLRSGGNAASSLAVLTGSLSVTDKVGIGTPNPGDKLSIQGGALSFHNSDNSIPYVGLDYDKTVDALRIRGNVGTRTLNTDYITIKRTSGNVGIGTTEPNRKLEMISDVRGLSFEAGTGSPHSGVIRFGDNTGWKLHFGRSRESSNSTTLNSGTTGVLMTIQDNGNVGVGVTDPSNRLHVSGTTGIRQNALYISGAEGGSSLTYNAHRNAANTDWVFPNTNRAAVTLEIDDLSGKQPRFQIYTTTSTNTQSWVQRLAIDGNSGNVVMAHNGGNVGIGTGTPGRRLTVAATSEHVQLLRSRAETTGGKTLFLELVQDDPNGRTVPEVFPAIRFHHGSRFWHRIEARSDGIHFRTGDLNSDAYVRIFAEGAIVTGMIVMWTGQASQIPVGWALCNGQNGTPNLTDRFIMGTVSDFSNAQDGRRFGGQANHAHGTSGPQGDVPRTTAMGGASFHLGGMNHTHTTGEASHIPPFYKVAFIMKL